MACPLPACPSILAFGTGLGNFRDSTAPVKLITPELMSPSLSTVNKYGTELTEPRQICGKRTLGDGQRHLCGLQWLLSSAKVDKLNWLLHVLSCTCISPPVYPASGLTLRGTSQAQVERTVATAEVVFQIVRK